MCLGVPGRLVEIISDDFGVGAVEISGVRRPVNMGMLADRVVVGDWVLVHVGFAVARLDEQEAQRTLAWLQEMSEAHAEGLRAFETTGGQRSSAVRPH